MPTEIQWADETWNPIVGCSKISDGCRICYAERKAAGGRLQQFEKYQKVITDRRWNGSVCYSEKELSKPIHWKTPKRIFVCSMGDIFHENVTWDDESKTPFILRVFSVMQRCPQHTFMVLTKRPHRALQFCKDFGLIPDPYLGCATPSGEVWPENVLFGVTVESQQQANERMHYAIAVPAPGRFISVEPMLGPVQLHSIPFVGRDSTGNYWPTIHGVICGGETGINARPMNPQWVRRLRDDCIENNTPFFFKQWGEWGPDDDRTGPTCETWYEWPDGGISYRRGKQNTGNTLDGRTYEQFPERASTVRA